MDSQVYYYNVFRLNNQHTMLVPGDSFNFYIKVLYRSMNIGPRRLQHNCPPRSILCHDFFQEGQDFLQTLLSGTHFSIQSLEEITERVVSTVQELFQVGSGPPQLESQHRVIPLSVTIIILNYGMHTAMEESTQYFRMNLASNEAMIKSFLKKSRFMIGSEDCCICLEGFDMNAECYTMACNHAFHLPCILTWLKIRPLCPLCRYPLPTLEN